MKASYRWLRALLPGLEASADEVSERLTAAGLEVEGVVRFGAGLEPVVVARVTKIEPHPSKSGLRLVTVDRGGGEQRVVCGAPNVPEPGGLVALAPLGTTLPAVGMTIAPRAIGGVTSEGMLCSEAEMGLGAGGEGIVVLDEGTPGQRFIDAVPSASDVIFELNVTPNRPDALGHVGLARELAALYALPFTPRVASLEGVATQTVAAGKSASLCGVQVQVDDASGCPYYGAAVLEGLAVGPSPAWLRHRLYSLGVRPISNLVDLTNLLLLERSQPMHAFDLDRVRGGEIRVRRAGRGERLETLDGKARELTTEDLVIADREGAIALAGVMGGASTEISASTRRVLLECAVFEPRSIRRAARRHGLHTEASHRFERGVDRGGARAALARAIEAARELAPGVEVGGEAHVEGPAAERKRVVLRSRRLDDLLGVAVPFGEATAILERLGCEVARRATAAGDVADVTTPSHRPDLGREADLIEEVSRVRGLGAIPAVLPPIVPQAPRSAGRVEARLRRAAVELGLSEAITYAFVSRRELSALSAPEPAVTLTNPLSEERSVMRTSLLPGLIEAVARARRHGERSARLFTVGHTFLEPEAREALPLERRGLAAVLAGPRAAHLSKAEEHDVYDAKAIAVELCERVTGRAAEVTTFDGAPRRPHLHPRGAARVTIDGREVGRFGPLHPDVIEALDLGAGMLVVELNVDALDAIGHRAPRAAHVPRLPAVARDLAFDVSEDVTAGAVAALIREAAGELCERVEVFDVFRGGHLGADRKSMAFHVVYRDPRDAAGVEGAKTLTDAEVDARNAQVKAAVEGRLGAQQRA